MTFYMSTHYNFSWFLEPITEDLRNLCNQVLMWFKSNPQLCGTVSMNSLFLFANLWEQEPFIKDISKLCLTKNLELSDSFYSNYVPTFSPNELEYLSHQMNSSFQYLREIYPEKYIKGFYPPFGIWDDRVISILEDFKCKYVIMDWYIIEQALSTKPVFLPSQDNIRPYRLKNSDIIAIPSFNFHSGFSLFPDRFSQYLKSGQFKNFVSFAQQALNYSEEGDEDIIALMTLDFNDLKFPKFPTEFDFDNFFTETSILAELPIKHITPSEIPNITDSIEELEIPSALPYELSYLKKKREFEYKSATCDYFISLFEKELTFLKSIEKLTDIIQERFKKQFDSLISYTCNFYLTTLHNFCFPIFGEYIKNVSFSKLVTIWDSINHLNLVGKILEMWVNASQQNSIPQFSFKTKRFSQLVFKEGNLLCSFETKGGVLSNIIDLEEGKVVTMTPSPSLVTNPFTQEPDYGLMHDIISKRQLGQFNLFHEWYNNGYVKNEEGTAITFSCFTVHNILLEKTYTLYSNSKRINIKYEFKNTGNNATEGEMILYSLSKLNVCSYHNMLTTKDDITHNFVINEKEGCDLEILNKKANCRINIKLPSSIKWNIKSSFYGKYLTLQMKTPPLKAKEQKSYSLDLFFSS